MKPCFARATETLAMRNNNFRQFKLERERWFIGNLFCTKDAPVVCYSSRITRNFKRNIKTQQWLLSDKKLNNCGIQKYNQQLLSRKLDHPKRLQILSHGRNNRLFSTTTKSTRKIGRHIRKKKPLLPSSNKNLTTKDRLRLSSRPSASAMNIRLKENDMMIKSPEELVERMYSGLDVVRTAVREGYTSLRNPTVANSSGRNVGDKNQSLSARPASSGISKGTKPIDQKGLVMDTNWWFWNLLFAASPAVGIALYCKLIVEPEMKIRNEQRAKDAASEAKEKTNASLDDAISDDKLRDNSVSKMSNVQKRQEQRKNQQQQQPDDGTTTTTTNSPSSLPLKSSGHLDEILSSYILPLATWFSEEKSLPTPTSEHGRSLENRTDEVEKRSTNMNPNADQEQQNKEISRLNMQQEELRELQSKLQKLKDKIDRQQQQCADLDADSDIIVSENSAERESLLSSIGKLTKSSSAVGTKLGREQWASLLSRWQGSGDRQQPSDKSNCGGDGIGNGDSDIIPTNGRVIAHGKGNTETPYNAVQTAPTN